uniref:ARAD1C13838p n=1 Tax=Blastobotrys adeninivorans TaxID=409370 RepID=A0A060T154_BLAAD
MMLPLSAFLIVGVLLLASTVAASPGYLQLDTIRKPDSNAPSMYDQLAKRADTQEWTLTNQDNYAYLVNITVGDPPQEFQARLDTASSDLWVIDKDNPLCAKTEVEYAMAFDTIYYMDCNESGIFDPNASTTLNRTDEDFFAKYTYGTIGFPDVFAAKGKFAYDDVSVAGTTIKQMKLGIAEVANRSMVVGIGLPSNEFRATYYDEEPYLNLPARLAQEGIIKTNAYSLWLNHLNENRGSILFGGVDHAKYEGTLQTLPMIDVPHYDPGTTMAVMMSGLTISPKENDSDPVQLFSGNIAVILDSGSSMSYLPIEVSREIARALDYNDENCNYEGYLEFEFNGFSIKVPFSDLLTPRPSIYGGVVISYDGTPVCSLAILESIDDDGPFILGDSVLRNAYVVYDLDRKEISMAQAKFNVSESNIETIDSNGVPSATKAQGYDQTTTATSLSMEPIGTDVTFTTTGQVSTLTRPNRTISDYGIAYLTMSSHDFFTFTSLLDTRTYSFVDLWPSNFTGPSRTSDTDVGVSCQNRDALRATIVLVCAFAVLTTGLLLY